MSSIVNLQFFGIGIGVLMALALISRNRPWVRALGAVLLLSTIIGVWLAAPPLTLGSEEAWYSQSPWREVVLFVAMILGMAARYLTQAIEVRRTEIAALRAQGKKGGVSIRFDIWEFIYPMLVSVITFGTLLPYITNRAELLPCLIIAFQTGFFWQTILSRASESIAKQ